jgi:rare lipoprotein A (peptidoglycan hydrolase)
MRKSQTRVIAPPVRRKPVSVWLAGLALLGHLGIAVWMATYTPALANSFPTGGVLHGQATWYGAELQGEPTASGEPFDMYGLTAAHRTLPLGTRAQVTNPATGKSVIVRINDRGPGRPGVMIDLSYGAAQAIGLKGSGPVDVAPLR